MKVTKDIDIKDLKEVFKRQVDFAIKEGYENVGINFVTALRILDVLEETQIMEERHQTLESACTFMEIEDGTQTNEMELHNKKDENGNILRGAKAYEKITKITEHLQKEQNVIPKCFCDYEYFENLGKCFKCEYKKECATKSDITPDCYGCYDDKNLDCNNCKRKEYCVEYTEKRKEEDNKKPCFGNYIYCYMCKHCIDFEKCKEKTIHREDVEKDNDFI